MESEHVQIGNLQEHYDRVDDIAVGVKNDNALMIIKKDFSPSLKEVGSKRPWNNVSKEHTGFCNGNL